MERKLFLMEQAMCLMTEQIPINFAMLARVDGEISETSLRDALRKMQARHPLLRARIQEKADGIFYTDTNVPEIPLQVIEQAGTEDWLEAASRELTISFNPRIGPMLRLLWLKNGSVSDLLLVSHHAIGDGYSAVTFFRDLFTYLAEPAKTSEPLPVLPSLPEMFPVSGKMRFQAQVARFALKLMSLKRMVSKSKPREMKPLQEMRHHLHPWKLSSDETTRLVERARRENTSVHAALGVAFMRAFGDFDTHPAEKRWKRSISSPISTRKLVNQPVDEHYGLFIIVCETTVDCHPSRDFWQVAREVKADLAKQADPEKIATNTYVMSSFTIQELEGVDFFNKSYDTSITNLGRIDMPGQFGNLKVKEIYGPIVSAAEKENVVGVSTFGGAAHFIFVTDHATLSPERVDEIIAKTRQNLLHHI